MWQSSSSDKSAAEMLKKLNETAGVFFGSWKILNYITQQLQIDMMGNIFAYMCFQQALRRHWCLWSRNEMPTS